MKEQSNKNRIRFSFINRNVPIINEDGDGIDIYPCIVLVDTFYNLPVAYTGYERFIQSLVASDMLDGSTLSKKSFAVCSFLNYIMHYTNINRLCEVTLNDIREFLKASRHKNEQEDYTEDTWKRQADTVYKFLRNYYVAYRDKYEFMYDGNDLQEVIIAKSEKSRRKYKVVSNSMLHVKPPATTHKKNRVLAYGYLDLLIYEAKKYDPMLALAIALQAYAGLREGELVNLSCGRVRMDYGAFNTLTGIELDLSSKALFWFDYNYNTPQGNFKKNQFRVQKVFDDFVSKVKNLYEDHILMLSSKGFDTSDDAPLFLNTYGRPMTSFTYLGRVKNLFYRYFLPELKITSLASNSWAENAAFIETYEEEYPGAHMFRHWFTMYLITKAKLEYGEIMKWRNDHSTDSMVSYLHENSDLIEAYRTSSFIFQNEILEEAYKEYGEYGTLITG